MAERTAGIVLAGGRSRRMGAPKAALEWHGSTLLRRVVGLLGRAVDGPVVVVRAPGQQLPSLPAGIEVVEDARDGRGPLQAVAAGLARVADRAGVVYVSGVDAPLLHPAFVRCVLRSLRDGDDVAVPYAHGHPQPLAAAYRTSVATRVNELIAGDRLAVRALLGGPRVRALQTQALLADAAVAANDPDLHSLLNLNVPEDYRAARARPAPSVIVRVAGEPEARIAQAATLATAAAVAGLALGRQIVVTLDGHGAIDDPQEPLASGDALTFGGLAGGPAERS